MEKIRKNIIRYKYLYIVDFILIFFIFLFPMEQITSGFVSSEGNRTGYVLDKNVVVRQEFTSKLDNIERISLMISTIDKNENCEINFKLLNNLDKVIDEKKINNSDLSYTESSSDSSTSYVNLYLKNKQFNTKNSVYYIELSTSCDSIIKVQYYNAELDEKKAVYDGVETNKKLAIRYSGTKKSFNNILYPFVIVIMTLIIILGGKNEKK